MADPTLNGTAATTPDGKDGAQEPGPGGWAALSVTHQVILSGVSAGVGVGLLALIIGCLVYAKARANTRRRIQALSAATAAAAAESGPAPNQPEGTE